MFKLKKRYKIVSKGRLFIFVLFILILVISLSTKLVNNSSENFSKTNYTEIQIQSGDTLWEIASKFNSTQDDLRKVVFEICKINNITANNIYPGQTVIIPNYI
ncbi:cell division suppressor protein YneA [Anaerovorax odorimutans]|uniref:cell division suppressor protein YneA n=1 Tax=Anaerovorax odorimutans TaxID=109327 RepID=UPI00041E8EF6|nr:LysM peptidoglycan-binding domain-containing protein [Anaerovorax odorimutans]